MPADDSVNSAAKDAEGSCLISSTVPRSLSLGYDQLMLGQAAPLSLAHKSKLIASSKARVPRSNAEVKLPFSKTQNGSALGLPEPLPSPSFPSFEPDPSIIPDWELFGYCVREGSWVVSP